MAVNFFPDSDTGGGVVSGDYIPLTQRGSANGVATLDSSAKVPQSQLPNISITDTFVVDSQSEMLALVAQTGDIAVRTDNNKTFILKSSPATSLANWVELPTPTNGVFSVDGKTGAVILSSDYQAKSNELTSLSALSDSPGFIKKISDGVYAIDGSSYLTSTLASTSYQPLNDGLTRISGLTPDGFLIKVGGIWGMDTNSYQIQDGDLTAIASLTTTGYLERTGTNTWRTVSGPFQPLDTDLTDIASLTGNGIIRKTAGVWGLDTTNYQIANNELSGFSALPDVQGFVRKVGDGSYTLDSNTYLTTASATSSYQPLNTNLTGISGLVGTTGTPKITDGVWVLDAMAYLTGNQTITLSGDISGSGTTSITATLPNIVTAGSSAKPIYNAKGLITGGGALLASDIPSLDWAKITTGKPTTLGGYGITDAYTKLEIDGSLSNKQNLSNELTALSSLADTPGLIRKTGDGTYAIDTSVYLTTSTASSSYQPLNTNLTGVSGLTGLDGIARKTGGVWSLDASNYLTSNQTITLSGDISGSGTTSITATLPNIVTAGSSAKPIYNAKGLITSSGTLLASDIPPLDATKITTGTIPDARLGGTYSGILSLIRPGTTNTLSLKGGNEAPGSGAFIHLYGKDNLGGQAYIDTGAVNVRSLDGAILHGRIDANGLSINASTFSTSTTTGALRINGGVGVQGNQYIGGFSSLGGDANHPAIKIKVLTGTTASTEGGTASVAHGVTSSKIVSILVLVESSPGVFISNLHLIAEGYSFDFYFDNVNVAIRNQAAKSANILSKPLKVTIAYTS